MLKWWPRILLAALAGIYILALVTAYRGLDVAPLVKTGKSIRAGARHVGHYRHYPRGGGLSVGK